MKFFLCLFLCLGGVHLSAQQLQWQKLNSEPYPGKQDDICFVSPNWAGTSTVMAAFKLQKSPE